MDPDEFGIEQVTDEDRAYRGSHFAEVRDAIFANPYQRIWGGAGESSLPCYKVSLSSVLPGLLPFGPPNVYRQAAERTIESHADLRFGPDGKGFRRIIHPNGICLTGLWEITAETGYSGYFRQGSRGLVIARYSVCCSETKRGELRSLALTGKLFPTLDPNHAEPLVPANFFTQQDIGGERTATINDAELRNAPDITPWRRGTGVVMLVVTGVLFSLVDKQGTVRQLYQIAELGKPPGMPTHSPRYMRLLVSADQPRIEGEGLDFRDEVMAQIFDKDDPIPKRRLVFDIEVTDEGKVLAIAGYTKWTFANWRRIGRLTFDNAVCSTNGDFVLHFNHPRWRDDLLMTG